MNRLNNKIHEVDFCVIGGGISGMLAAIAAARHGVRVALIHDRPVLGGNASSEIKMWICGAGSRVKNLQETGILEEIALENMLRNPERNYSIWDSILYEKVRFEPNIELFLNCACMDAQMNGNSIVSVTGFQLTTYTHHTIKAKIFADCSGDSILSDLTGAQYRVGRESKVEFGEEFGVEVADRKTMGMSLLIQAKETGHYCAYVPPKWSYTYKTDADMRNKPHTMLKDLNTNFYWIELGGEQDTIADTEEIRDELLKIAFGVWDHMKNQGDHGAENWELEWIGFLPGKRESRRYVGDYILTQNDVENGVKFDDEVAYGGWQIDNHLPGGFNMVGEEGFHLQKRRLSEPYGIPYRCLYSKNIDNLMFAGRNISATHIGFSTTRVMGTCGIMGQAVGTAASVAIKNNLLPREVYSKKIKEVQNKLMEDDCFLPHFKREISSLSKQAKLTADYGEASIIQNGIDRKIWGNDNGYWGKINKAITYTFDKPTEVKFARLICDSDLDREYVEGNPNLMLIPMPLFKALSYNRTSFGFPKCMLKAFNIDVLDGDGQWKTVYQTNENYQRFLKISLDVKTTAVRIVPLATHGSDELYNTYGSASAHIFAFEVI